jgi:hypothetical protein
MRQRLTWLLLVGAAIMVMALHYAGNVWATTVNSGFKATTIATGTFGEFAVFTNLRRTRFLAGSLVTSGYRCRRRRDFQTCTCRAMSGRRST